MVPILWLALRRGWKIGIFGGAVFGVVDLAIGAFIVNPVQLVLDYPLAFAVLGLAGLFPKYPVVGVVVGVTGRFVSHFVSGIVYFADYAPIGMSPVIYSARASVRSRDWCDAEEQSADHLPVTPKHALTRSPFGAFFCAWLCETQRRRRHR
jgi:energy-coupled thiamine transporter ThiT